MASLDSMNGDIVLHVFEKLDDADIVKLGNTCKNLYKASNNPQLWKKKYQDLGGKATESRNWKNLFINASTQSGRSNSYLKQGNGGLTPRTYFLVFAYPTMISQFFAPPRNSYLPLSKYINLFPSIAQGSHSRWDTVSKLLICEVGCTRNLASDWSC